MSVSEKEQKKKRIIMMVLLAVLLMSVSIFLVERKESSYIVVTFPNGAVVEAEVADTPEKLAGLGEAALTEKIKTIGLYRSKARNLIALSRKLVDEHGSKVPESREVLETLPGVGRKTANVVLNVAFGEPTIAVDTHVFRVANRTGLAPGKTPEEVERRLLKFVPEEFRHHAHHWLILHGRYVCVARTPNCGACAIRDLCEYRDKSA